MNFYIYSLRAFKRMFWVTQYLYKLVRDCVKFDIILKWWYTWPSFSIIFFCLLYVSLFLSLSFSLTLSLCLSLSLFSPLLMCIGCFRPYFLKQLFNNQIWYDFVNTIHTPQVRILHLSLFTISLNPTIVLFTWYF